MLINLKNDDLGKIKNQTESPQRSYKPTGKRLIEKIVGVKKYFVVDNR